MRFGGSIRRTDALQIPMMIGLALMVGGIVTGSMTVAAIASVVVLGGGITNLIAGRPPDDGDRPPRSREALLRVEAA